MILTTKAHPGLAYARRTAADTAQAFVRLVTRRRQGSAGRDARLQASGSQPSLRTSSSIAQEQASGRPSRLVSPTTWATHSPHSPDESGPYGMLVWLGGPWAISWRCAKRVFSQLAHRRSGRYRHL